MIRPPTAAEDPKPEYGVGGELVDREVADHPGEPLADRVGGAGRRPLQ